jgi:lysophospholipase L1-like esterase
MLAKGNLITIVALGSSSTEGIGASSPDKTYPRRLAVELEHLFPGQDFNVINRGVGGETSVEMLARLDRDVRAAKPDLIIWQVGSNSLLKDHPLAAEKTRLHEGVSRMKAMGADVILLDPQYAPSVLAKHDAQGMVDLIGAEAKSANVDIFQRFALMRQWHDAQGLPFEAFVSPDMLHMNDWGYRCLAKTLAMTIGEAVTRPVVSANARPAAGR